ncbi:MAG: SCP2 sterol-binding domain-containing protein, partial [Ardenticatenaceae bacterium]|nr:SCP2 sterol-binding domain-containing protein [Ardenticatenaceae bacterium]
TRVKESLYHQLPQIIENPAALEPYELRLTPGQRRALLEVITGSGCDRRPSRHSPEDHIIMWQNSDSTLMPTYKLLGADSNGRPVLQKGDAPRFAILELGQLAHTFYNSDQPAAGRVTVQAWFESLAARLRQVAGRPETAVVQFDISGENGRVAALTLHGNEISLIDGRHPDPTVTISATDSTWLALLNGEAAPDALFLQGKLAITGNLELVLLLAETIAIAPPSKLRPDQWRLEFNYQDLLTLVYE